MALKVVPAGDERCDVHTGRTPRKRICESCMKELRIDPATVAGKPRLRRRIRPRRAMRRLRSVDWRILVGAALASIALIVVLTSVLGGGGGHSTSGAPTQAKVVDALGLSPDPSGVGWITLDGACAVLSIQIGPKTQPAPQAASTASVVTNADGTVRAVVQNAFSQSQAACVSRISAALRAHF